MFDNNGSHKPYEKALVTLKLENKTSNKNSSKAPVSPFLNLRRGRENLRLRLVPAAFKSAKKGCLIKKTVIKSSNVC